MSRWDHTARKAPPLTMIGADHRTRRKRRLLCIEVGATLAALPEESPEGWAILDELISALGPMTLAEVGHVLGIRKQRVLQLESRALVATRRRFRLMGWCEESAARALEKPPSPWEEITRYGWAS